ncbi:F-box/LRR-repeat protein At3g48880-like [Lotus japonicus]|uniref:F-box/LRR-repeat protein At3g48880-like n=1 Tax=Lotus japonicus TaxID=34305 RepID=UPI00258CEA98|nr:F-box/LRR-repeat protein At3g48880-like [Lotus japonicus]
MASWRGLESMTITSMINCRYLFSAISKWCKNIVELKFTYDFKQDHADALIKYTPNLKVLSLRTILVEKKALEDALDGLKHLKVVNICHSFIWGIGGDNNPIGYFSRSYPKKSMSELVICLSEGWYEGWCLKCTRHKNGLEKMLYTDGYLEDIWREDEIDSLAH